MKKIPVRQIKPAPKQPLSTGQFTIRPLADIVQENGLVHELHRHDFYFILALKNGIGSHEIDFMPYSVQDHTVFMLRPGQVHRLMLDSNATGFLLEFDREYYHRLEDISGQRLKKAANKNYCAFESGRFEKLYAMLALIYEEYSSRETGYQDVIKSALDIFFTEYIRQSHGSGFASLAGASYSQERYEVFMDLLEKHIATHKQVSQYAQWMNISSYQLNEIVKSSVGKTPSDLINAQIVLEAKRYLLATSNQVKDIADQLGYEDYSYFIRFFKKHVGYTPESFRIQFKHP